MGRTAGPAGNTISAAASEPASPAAYWSLISERRLEHSPTDAGINIQKKIRLVPERHVILQVHHHGPLAILADRMRLVQLVHMLHQLV